jgi:hypothetical protein
VISRHRLAVVEASMLEFRVELLVVTSNDEGVKVLLVDINFKYVPARFLLLRSMNESNESTKFLEI